MTNAKQNSDRSSSEKLLFCHIGWYESYDGTEADTADAETFLPVEITGEDGNVHSLMLGTAPGKTVLPLASLTDCPETGFAEGVTVVFCAEAPNGAEVTVGWFRAANVSAQRETLALTDDDGTAVEREFFFCCHTDDAVLLPYEARFSFLPVPRNKSNKPGKFGLPANGVWIVRERSAEKWRQDALARISGYSGENLLDHSDNTLADEDEIS